MKIITGDLIKLAKKSHFDVIIHGCNCKMRMGSGIAKQIKKEFPVAYHADKYYEKNDNERLGEISIGVMLLGDREFHIVNAYTQYGYGRTEKQVDYQALRKCFKKIKQTMHGLRIGYPKIGAGLGGGDWYTIAQIIDEELRDEDHTLVVYEID